MSSDLQWLLVKDSNSFLVKRNGVQFSSEPGNLANLNSFKYSGIVNAKTVGLTTKDGKIELSLKKYAAFSILTR